MLLVFMSLSVWLPVEGSASGLEGQGQESPRSDRLVDQLPHPEMERIVWWADRLLGGTNMPEQGPRQGRLLEPTPGLHPQGSPPVGLGASSQVWLEQSVLLGFHLRPAVP